MPPKKVEKGKEVEVVQEEKNLSISIKLLQNSLHSKGSSFRLRIVCSWMECCTTTEVFGSESIPWEMTSEENIRKASLIFEYNPTLPDISVINSSPYVYAFLLEQKESSRVPVTFASVDCSEFVLNDGTKQGSSGTVEGVRVELSVAVKKSLFPKPEVVPYDPLILYVDHLLNYPQLSHSSLNTFDCAFQNVYIYAHLNFGSFSRDIFARPFSLMDGSSQSLSASINVSTCLLPGLADVVQFKDLLSSTTFVCQIHDDDLCKRSFQTHQLEEYNRLLGVVPVDAGASAPAAAGKGGKDKPKAGGKGPAVPEVAPSSSPAEAISEADRHLLACIAAMLKTGSKIFCHGSFRFRLDSLLSSSEDLLEEFRRLHSSTCTPDDTIVVKDSVMVHVKMQKPSQPIKWTMPSDISLKKVLRRAQDEDIRKRDPNAQIIIVPTPRHELFESSGTTVKLRCLLLKQYEHPKPFVGTATLTHRTLDEESDLMEQLNKRLKETPFTRMVIAFRYDDDYSLHLVNEAIATVNSKALPDIQGSLRSYSFTEEETAAAIRAELDVVTGFTIIDDDVRVVVLEGLAGIDKGMQSVFLDIPRQREDDKNLKILCNPDVMFPDRLYAEFGPDLKRIRIRDKLKKLARKPELYNRKQVEEITFAAVESIMSLRRAPDLLSTKTLALYPTAESLNNLELLYGEAISIADLDGKAAEAARKKSKTAAATASVSVSASAYEQASPGRNVSSAPMEASKTFSRSQLECRCPPIDCRNEDYEHWLKVRDSKRVDFLAEQREIRRKAWKNMLLRRSEIDNQLQATLTGAFGKDPSHCKVFMYSQQKLNYSSIALEEMKKSLSKVKDAAFTYNKEFNSQTVNATVASKGGLKDDWLTPSGFQYPKPKSTKELIGHPKKPSEARIEDLREAFDSASLMQAEFDPRLLQLEKGYSVRLKPGLDFGNLEEPVYENQFQLSLIGDRKKLPRGVLVKGSERNKDFFRSVHLGGDDAVRIMEEAIAKEKKDWEDAVVVDHNDFKVGGYSVRDRPILVDRTKDILKDEPKTAALKHLREMKSCTGRDFSLGPTPMGLMSQEPYVPNAVGTALLRTKDESKFVTATLDTQRPVDFTSFINKDANAPKLFRMVAKKKHEPLRNSYAEVLPSEI